MMKREAIMSEFRFGTRLEDGFVQINPFDRRLTDVGRMYANNQVYVVLRFDLGTGTPADGQLYARPMHAAVPRLRRVFRAT
jgi:hypothetical protein